MDPTHQIQYVHNPVQFFPMTESESKSKDDLTNIMKKSSRFVSYKNKTTDTDITVDHLSDLMLHAYIIPLPLLESSEIKNEMNTGDNDSVSMDNAGENAFAVDAGVNDVETSLPARDLVDTNATTSASTRLHKRKSVYSNFNDSQCTRSFDLVLTMTQKTQLRMLAKAYNYIWNRAILYIQQHSEQDIEGRQAFQVRQKKNIDELKQKHNTKLQKLKNSNIKKINELHARIQKATNQITNCKLKNLSKRNLFIDTRQQKIKLIARTILTTKAQYKRTIRNTNKDLCYKISKIERHHYISKTLLYSEIRKYAATYIDANWENEAHYKWFRETLSTTLCTNATRDAAALNICSILKACKQKQTSFFTIKKRSRKNNDIVIFNKRDFRLLTRDKALGTLHCKTKLGLTPIIEPPSEFKIIRNRRTGVWRLYYTLPLSTYADMIPDAQRRELIALDPGVNRFITGLDMETTQVLEIGTVQDLHSHIVPLKNRAEKLGRLYRKFEKTTRIPKRVIKTRGQCHTNREYTPPSLCTYAKQPPQPVERTHTDSSSKYADHKDGCKLCIREGARTIELGDYRVCISNNSSKQAHDHCENKCHKCRRRILRRLKRNKHRLENKVSLRIKDAQCCIAKALCQNFRTILLPEFKVKGMCGRGKSGKSTRKDMQTWSHYKFKHILTQAARRANTNVIETWEPYTSKSCCTCLRLTLFQGDTFECQYPDCGLKINRDWNGASNNGIAFLRRSIDSE